MNSAANSVKVHSGMIGNISESLSRTKRRQRKDISNLTKKMREGSLPWRTNNVKHQVPSVPTDGEDHSCSCKKTLFSFPDSSLQPSQEETKQSMWLEPTISGLPVPALSLAWQVPYNTAEKQTASLPRKISRNPDHPRNTTNSHF